MHMIDIISAIQIKINTCTVYCKGMDVTDASLPALLFQNYFNTIKVIR